MKIAISILYFAVLAVLIWHMEAIGLSFIILWVLFGIGIPVYAKALFGK